MLMKRTQIYIDLETYQRAKALASTTGQTLSQVVRASIKSYVKPKPKSNSLVELAKFAKKFPDLAGTPNDLSINHDHYLYGTPKKKIPKK